MTDLLFSGPFAKEMTEFILTKRATGLKYETEAGIIARFGKYLAENYPTATTLTKEMVTGWCAMSPWETLRNRASRSTVIRQFSIFLVKLGRDAWILPTGIYQKVPKYVPHIYTTDELRRFFAATDACHFTREVPFRHLVMPEFFRLLFACGLRSSEARLLKAEDVDLDTGILTVLNSKNGNDRLVPISASIVGRLRIYVDKIHAASNDCVWFFPGFKEKPMTLGNVYKNFRRFLWKAGISHTGDGPRVHDFRHTFCVYRLREWASTGKDLLAMLPILCTYLGHKSLADTAYYLQWTADVFPEIRLQLESAYAAIVPDLERTPDETN